MSELTANTVFPLASALSDSEKKRLLDMIQSSFDNETKRNQNKQRKTKSIQSKFLEENEEILIHEVIHGKT